MIRDPSDGSVKTEKAELVTPTGTSPGVQRMTSADNWGLKSLNREARKPKPVPTAEELRAHYEKFKLGFKPKESE